MTSSYDWNGRVGDIWADEWRRTDRSFAGLSPSLDAAILAAAPMRGSAVDIGSGAGGTAISLAVARPGLDVLGIDISPQLVAVARQRSAGVGNVHFDVVDAARLAVRGVALFVSRHGVMFFDDPVVAFTALRRAALPQAKLVFSCFSTVLLNSWATETVAAITGAAPPAPGTAPSPFAFQDIDHVARILRESGWVGEPSPVDYRYRAGEGPSAVEDAVDFFSRIGPAASQLAAIEGEARTAATVRLRDYLARNCENDAVTFPAAAWIWTATAGDPA